MSQDSLDLEKLQSLNTVGTISYILHLIVAVGALIPGGQFGPVLLIVALIIDLVKRPEAVGTWHASHFSWRIRTVVIAALLYAVTVPLWFFFILPGWIAWILISIWFLYRIVTGLVRMNKGLAMETTA
ncbi:MAG: hypothetical protein HHJ17_01820 [Rhodoferax sp.]|uniref:DUF4870 family protein n=1 Tax=Rhodoferax sp. TaxID=50421 RepID=UPI0018470B18|nr:hypothetical protein [Rhodoferax sp.]NMM12267.1 hypothetical protein [Rhodoferax sp.]NMM20226.1 hypothetical protein [Rhodoferax sp.]